MIREARIINDISRETQIMCATSAAYLLPIVIFADYRCRRRVKAVTQKQISVSACLVTATVHKTKQTARPRACTITKRFVISIARLPYKISRARNDIGSRASAREWKIVQRAGQSNRHGLMNFSRVSTRGRRHWESRYLPRKTPLFGLRSDLSVRLEECRAMITTCRCGVTVHPKRATFNVGCRSKAIMHVQKQLSRPRLRQKGSTSENNESRKKRKRHKRTSLAFNDECQLIFLQRDVIAGDARLIERHLERNVHRNILTLHHRRDRHNKFHSSMANLRASHFVGKSVTGNEEQPILPILVPMRREFYLRDFPS